MVKGQAFSSRGESSIDIAPEVLGRKLVATPVASQGVEPPSDQIRRLWGVISMVIEALREKTTHTYNTHLRVSLSSSSSSCKGTGSPHAQGYHL